MSSLVGYLVEAETDREANVGNGQIPELVLQDDGHFIRKALSEAVGNIHVQGRPS